MTLGVVSFCPLNPTLPSTGVVMVADTRLTVPGWSPFDLGRKVFKVGKYAGYVYCGLSCAGIAPLPLLRAYFKTNEKPSNYDTNIASLMEAGIRFTNPLEPMSWYQGVVAYCNAEGSYTRVATNPYAHKGQLLKACVWEGLVGPILLGSGAAHFGEFNKFLSEGMASQPTEVRSRQPIIHSLFLAHAVSEFVRARIDPLVGGGVHGAMLNHQMGFKYLHFGARPAECAVDEPYTMLTPRALTALP